MDSFWDQIFLFVFYEVHLITPTCLLMKNQERDQGLLSLSRTPRQQLVQRSNWTASSLGSHQLQVPHSPHAGPQPTNHLTNQLSNQPSIHVISFRKQNRKIMNIHKNVCKQQNEPHSLHIYADSHHPAHHFLFHHIFFFPLVTWRKNNVELRRNASYAVQTEGETHTLLIKELRAHTAGSYCVTAANTAGTSSCRATLSIHPGEKIIKQKKGTERVSTPPPLNILPLKKKRSLTSPPALNLRTHQSCSDDIRQPWHSESQLNKTNSFQDRISAVNVPLVDNVFML